MATRPERRDSREIKREELKRIRRERGMRAKVGAARLELGSEVVKIFVEWGSRECSGE